MIVIFTVYIFFADIYKNYLWKIYTTRIFLRLQYISLTIINRHIPEKVENNLYNIKILEINNLLKKS